jgi:hypothetical protein
MITACQCSASDQSHGGVALGCSYELLAVKQKFARLAFQAGPRPWAGPGSWASEELRALKSLVEPFQQRSEETCERCGRPGRERDSRPILLTLCDACEAEVLKA